MVDLEISNNFIIFVIEKKNKFIMTYNDFITEIWSNVDNCPKEWRKGQKVFNVIEKLYGNVDKDVQCIYVFDYFYDERNETINLFIDTCCNRMCSTNFKK